MELPYLLRQLGFADKDIRVYLALLSDGNCSARKITKDTELSKYAVNEALKKLRAAGLVGVYQKHKKQKFVAEDPEKLVELVKKREHSMAELKTKVHELLPELKSIYQHGGSKPSVKYYEGMKGVEIILKDVLSTMTELSGDKMYRVFSSPHLREFIYSNFPNFTKDRIARQIRVQILVMGEEGPGRPLMEQKTIPVRGMAPTYSFIYGDKVAFISIDEQEKVTGVIIDDASICQTQKIVFDHIWNQSIQHRRISVEATIAENL